MALSSISYGCASGQGQRTAPGQLMLPDPGGRTGPLSICRAQTHTRIGSNFGYAYQFDATTLLRPICAGTAKPGAVTRIEGKVLDTTLDGETGYVRSLHLDNGTSIEADLFVDCSGFRGILIEQALKTGYDDWSRWLPCNRAVAVPCESHGTLLPFTRATARTAGWQWRIPCSTAQAMAMSIGMNSFPMMRRPTSSCPHSKARLSPIHASFIFTTGRRKKFWSRNVVAVGLSAGFLEPLESTSIHLIQEGITSLIDLFPDKLIADSDVEEYNNRMALNFERVRDFLLLHYVATQRDDSEMWRHFRALTLPDSLATRLKAWRSRGYILKYEFGVFLPPSWIAVMVGQNLIPESYDPRVDRYAAAELRKHLDLMEHETARAVASTPDHAAFLRDHGAASPSLASLH